MNTTESSSSRKGQAPIKIIELNIEITKAKEELKKAKEELEKAEEKLKDAEEKLEKAEEELKDATTALANAEKNTDEWKSAEELVVTATYLKKVKMSYLANMTKNADELTTKVRNLKKTLEDLENQLSIQKSYVSIGSSETKASNFVEFQKAIQAPSQFALNVKNALETMKRYNIITYRVEDDMYCFAKARPPIILGSELLYNFFTSYSSNLDYIEDWSYAKEYQFWNFIDSMKRNYDSEENRTTVFRNCWKDLFGQYLTKDQLSTNISSCSKGKGYQIDLVDINKRILIQVKNEKINITSEPFIETVAYFVHSGQDEEVNERILVCIVGPSISVYGAVYCEISKEIIVEPLINLIFCEKFETELRALLVSLHKFSSKEISQNIVKYPHFAVSAFEPNTNYEQYTWIHNKSVCYLNDICIKFSFKKYSDEVHKVFAENGFAPKLLGDSKVIGEWIVVKLEYLKDYEPISTKKQYSPKQKELIVMKLNSLKEFLKNSENIVHGDLRAPNILIKFQKEAVDLKVIDFEWSGIAEQVYYPPRINEKVFSELNVNDIYPYSPIKKDHDIYWIDYIIDNLNTTK